MPSCAMSISRLILLLFGVIFTTLSLLSKLYSKQTTDNAFLFIASILILALILLFNSILYCHWPRFAFLRGKEFRLTGVDKNNDVEKGISGLNIRTRKIQ
ncbi:uncharacterized protein BJX67DRAFT_359494 [Aspergillus lucknowensis]|uniref:Uncharacterized protein n=1 Tax=Aspergillus lucknowensis TaxID=176173 RepID=A0ABR4LKE3_9EURO